MRRQHRLLRYARAATPTPRIVSRTCSKAHAPALDSIDVFAVSFF